MCFTYVFQLLACQLLNNNTEKCKLGPIITQIRIPTAGVAVGQPQSVIIVLEALKAVMQSI